MKGAEQREAYGSMLVIFREVAQGLATLDADSRHKIFDAVLDWYVGGIDEIGDLSPASALIATLIREKQLAYASVCRKRSAAGVRSGEVRRGMNNVQTKSNSESKSESESESESKSESSCTQTCVRPTIEDVRSYCRERGNKVDAQAWFDYYTSNGWRVGRNAMKDWRAAVRTWERNGVGVQKAKAAHGDNYIGATENQVREFSDGFDM